MERVPRILIVDDDPSNREGLSLLLGQENYLVEGAASGEEALKLIEKSPVEVMITDLFLPGMSGIEILKQVKENAPLTNVILVTGKASAESAVEAMKEGAFDYITKPVNIEHLKVQVAKALEKNKLLVENLYLREQLHGRYRFDNIIGTSPAMQKVFQRMEKIVETDSTILILGESGTGKELVAKALHFNGPRKDKPYVAINCGAIPSELLESELFGHVKGSFTGAVSDKAGKFEVANGGTIFLDEIGTMPQHLQTKLLRVLQEQEIERVGSSKALKLNVRVISATNANLQEEVRQGRFRDDLFYRLNVIPIELPPLRDRREDISVLVRHFLQKICPEMRRPVMNISPAAMRALEAYNWPGNVREIENVVERIVALTDGNMIHPSDLPEGIGKVAIDGHQDLYAPRVTSDGVDMPQVISGIEKRLISEALEMGKGVKARAARMLGINRTTLVEKMKRLGLE